MMAADLQEPVSLVRDFFVGLEGGEHDIAVGVRAIARRPRRIDARVAVVLVALPEAGRAGNPTRRRRYLRLHAAGREPARSGWTSRTRASSVFSTGSASADSRSRTTAQPRPIGRSAWGFRRKARYLLDSIFAFTDLPITAIIVVGVLGVVVSAALAIAVLVAWAAGQIKVAGYTPVMLALFLMSSMILIALGLVGSYVWRTYENSKGRPGAIAMTHERFDSRQGSG